MNAGIESGFCDLECWCHVPTRGINKPPCYLCVINRCSLSSKPDVAPSAPELSPSENTAPILFSSSGVSSEAPLDGEPFQNTTRYGWRPSIPRYSSLDFNQRPEDTVTREFPELYVQLPPGGDYEYVAENRNSSHEVELDDVIIPEPDYPGSYVGDHMAMEEETNDTATDSNHSWTTSNSEDSNRQHVTTIEVNWDETKGSQASSDDGHERTTDLAELIKSLVCDTERVTFADDEDDEMSERVSRPSTMSSSDINMNSRRRRDKYQDFHSPSLRTLSDPTVTRATSQQNISANPTQNESEYQLLHKIHRRDTSTDAARRYLQSDENLHRTWVNKLP